jgi:hypothetical protein
LVPFASNEGFTAQAGKQEPFHGYFYRILTKQGADAKEGAKGYVVNGKMTGGFAFIAYPEKYGDTGITTFIVNQNGIVYEKDLGKSTTEAATAATEFNRDKTWTAAPEMKSLRRRSSLEEEVLESLTTEATRLAELNGRPTLLHKDLQTHFPRPGPCLKRQLSKHSAERMIPVVERRVQAATICERNGDYEDPMRTIRYVSIRCIRNLSRGDRDWRLDHRCDGRRTHLEHVCLGFRSLSHAYRPARQQPV